MGRPIQKRWFGDTSQPGSQLVITAKLPGAAVSDGFILEQTGTRKYKVNIGGNIGDVFLVNKTLESDLLDGEAFIMALPFGGSPLPVFRLTQYRVTVFDGDGYSNYQWSSEAATDSTQADLYFETPPPAVEFTVTFDIGDGTLVSGDLVQEVAEGSDAVAPTITPAAGFTFVEWDTDFTNVTADITVTAQYAGV